MRYTKYLSLICFTSFAAFAQTDPYVACLDKTNGSSSQFHQCGQAEIQRLETKFNQADKKLLSLVKKAPSLQKAYKEEANTWAQYKSSSCQVYRDNETFGTNGAATFFYACRVDVLKQRIAYINELINAVD